MDHEQLPPGTTHVRTTPWFNEDDVPAGLLEAHQIAAGVWGRLVVDRGRLQFRFEDEDEPATVTLGPGDAIVIPPVRLHHIELVGPVRFAVEFHRLD
jgi:tellurite resistance-related uncharacterized protein